MAASGQLRAVNYLINSKQEFSVHWQKPRNSEIIPAAVIQSRAAGEGGTKTEDKCQAPRQMALLKGETWIIRVPLKGLRGQPPPPPPEQLLVQEKNLSGKQNHVRLQHLSNSWCHALSHGHVDLPVIFTQKQRKGKRPRALEQAGGAAR